MKAEKVYVKDLKYTIDTSTKTATLTGAWSYSSLSSIDVPATITYADTKYAVTSIASQAFNDCTGLRSLTIGPSVTSIGAYAFSGCTKLTSVKFGKSLVSIETGVFYKCTSLTSITTPENLISIGDSAFCDCI